MEQDVDTDYKTICCTCLSSDRNVVSINGLTQIYQVFRLIMYDYAGDRVSFKSFKVITLLSSCAISK